MAYDRERQPDSCGIVAAIQLALLLGFVGVAAVSVFSVLTTRHGSCLCAKILELRVRG